MKRPGTISAHRIPRAERRRFAPGPTWLATSTSAARWPRPSSSARLQPRWTSPRITWWSATSPPPWCSRPAASSSAPLSITAMRRLGSIFRKTRKTCSTSRSSTGCCRRAPRWQLSETRCRDWQRNLSEQPVHDQESEYQHGRADQHPQCEVLLDPDPDPFPKGVGQDPCHKEAHPACDDRAKDEQPDIETGKARRDGDELVGDRREPLADDDQCAPCRIAGAEGLDLVGEVVDLDQPMAERVIKQCANGIAQDAAEHGCHRADCGIKPGGLRPRQRH